MTAGLVFIRRIQGPLRLLVIHAVAALVITVTGVAAVALNHGRSNQIFYNFYLPVDFLLMLFAMRKLFGPRFGLFAGLGCAAFLIAGIISIQSAGVYKLATHAIVVYSTVLTICYFVVLLRNTNRESSRFTTGIYCIAISVMLYYCCVIPYFGFMHYINQQDVKLAGQLYYINHAFSSLRYIFTGIGFILLSGSTSPALHAYK